MKRLIDWAYHNPLIERLVHTSVYCLKRELRGCRSVLDLGCGPRSPLEHVHTDFSVGVDMWDDYLTASQERRIHSAYLKADLATLDFQSRSVDAVILIGVLEHMDKEDGRRLMQRAQQWARKRLIVSMPNGFLPQADCDGNPYQRHRSGWTVEDLRAEGFRVYGMTGWKPLRSVNEAEELEAASIFETIRFRPRLLWLAISELTQVFTYYLPKGSFELFAARDVALG
jgi:2-polyprenyl-3-methyl-5-hydroxy-6-metoxy-1,4-benzoquinol methylase